MPNPDIISCPVDVWTKIATGITSGIVHVIDTSPNVYLHTYRLTTQDPPVNNDDAAPFELALQIANSAAIDVYIQPKGKAGSVRVDL